MQDAVATIMKEEKEEKEVGWRCVVHGRGHSVAQLIMAEMEQRKAENLIVHHDEIHARAPRTWIVSAQQKLQTKGLLSDGV